MDHSPSVSGSEPLSDVGPPALACAAIVTGASSGIGRSIALALAEAGVGLVVCADVRIQPLTEGVEKRNGRRTRRLRNDLEPGARDLSSVMLLWNVQAR